MSQCHFQHPLTHYPAVYGVSYRTILRWAEKGYPLDDTDATRAAVESQKNAPQQKLAPQERPEGPRTRPSTETGALGLSANIGRLQAEEREAHAAFDSSKGGNDEPRALKAWLAVAEQLRRVEQSTPDVEQANRKSLRLDELRSELGALFTRLRQDLDSLPQRIALELVAKDEIGIREIVRREVEEIIRSLYLCKYLEGGSENE